MLREPPDLVFIDAEKEDYEELFALVREKLEPGGLVVADNVLSHVDPLGEYSRKRQSDPSLASVTIPLDRGLEVTVVLDPVPLAEPHFASGLACPPQTRIMGRTTERG